MKLTLWMLGSLLLSFIDINDIATVNALKRSAEEAFMDKNYDQAALDYSMLIDSMQVDDDRAMLNLAHAYYQLSDSSNARSSYQRLTMTDDKQLKSIAYQQLGMLNSSPDQLEKSLHFFKESVRANPANEEARYNYELVKKKLQEQEDQQDENQDQEDQDKKDQEDQEKNEDQEKEDQEKQDQEQKENEEQQDQEQEQQEQEQQDQEQQEQENSEEQQQKEEQEQKDGEQEQQEPQEGEESEQSEEDQPMPSPSEKLEEMNLSEEKANMILEAMRNSEVQYLQQMKKKATKKADSKKPDW